MAEVKKMVGPARHKERAEDIIRSLDVSSLKGKKVLVTGGGGFFGIHLSRALHMLGCSVVITDKGKPIEDYHEDIELVQGDIRDKELVDKLCEGVDCVFHIASFGMSGEEMLKNRDFIESINVGGTENVIEACVKNNVPRLVYTSTISVVLGSKAFDNKSEAELERIPPEVHLDNYSRTKSKAEILVIASNGRKLKNGEALNTCSIRPPGIYGAGEQRHFTRLVRMLAFYKANLGTPETKTNWVHVDNLVNGHLLASEGLSSNKKHTAAGQVYFITDRAPTNNSLFMKPLIVGLGYPFPDRWIPLRSILFLATIMELLHTVLKPFYHFQPILNKGEVYQAALHHTVSSKKAQTELGYQAVDRNLEDALEHLRQLGHQRPAASSDDGWTVSAKIKMFTSIAVLIVLVAIFI